MTFVEIKHMFSSKKKTYVGFCVLQPLILSELITIKFELKVM